jgi:predicted MFS family arabinose efflux permease
VPGAVLVTSALMLGVYTIVSPAAEDGWGSGRALGFGAASLVLLAAFIFREARTPNPLVPLRIFRSRNVSGANITQVLLVAGMFGMFFLGSLYLQRVLGYSALEIGLAFLPTTLVMGTLSVKYSERLVMRYGARRVLIPGLVVMAIGLAIFTQAPVDGGYWLHVFPVLVLLGLGVGLAGPALMNLAMSGVDQQDAGLASGLVNTSAQVGGALGLAVLATLSATRTEHLLAEGEQPLQALTSGYHLAFWIAAGLVVAAIGVALTVIEPDKAMAEQRAHESGAGEPAYSEA